MQSKFCSNRGLMKNLLKRYWPLWTTYLVLLFAAGPLWVSSNIQNMEAAVRQQPNYMIYQVLQSAKVGIVLSIVACVFVAMALYSYLYNTRGTGMICALPIRREDAFWTVWLTGLLPMLVADVIVSLLLWAMFGKLVGLMTIVKFLGIIVLSNVAFYGIGVFCVMLTGNALIVPVLYGVLNFAAVLLERAVQVILQILLYGYSYGEPKLNYLSPAVGLLKRLNVTCFCEWSEELQQVVYYGPVEVSGTTYLILLSIVGLILTATARMLYVHRQMENATDVVAVKLLRPVFRYGMAIAGGLVLPALVYALFFSNWVQATKAPYVLGIIAVIGCLLGYFGAEMLMKKSLRAFERWKGVLPVLALLLVFIGVSEADIYGYETRLPDLDEVKTVLFTDTWSEAEEPENLQSARDLQQQIIDHKAINESSETNQAIELYWYDADQNEVMHRVYKLSMDEDVLATAESDLRGVCIWSKNHELVMKRITPNLLPMNEETIYNCTISYSNEDVWYDVRLTAAQALELYETCIVPDAEDGLIATDSWLDSYFGLEDYSGYNVSIDLQKTNEIGIMEYDGIYLSVLNSSWRTLAYLQENCAAG